MRLYLTEYEDAAGLTQQSQVWARSERHAQALCNRRRLGEKVWTLGGRGDADKPAHAVLRGADALHALTWLSHLALMSRVATVHEITDDSTGILHRYAHYLTDRPTRAAWADLEADVRRLQRRVPGYLPPPRRRK